MMTVRSSTLGNALTGNVTAQLLGEVNQHLLNPLTSLAAGAFVDFATSGITKRLREEREKAVLASQISVAQNKHANQQAREEESRGTTTQVDHTSDNSHATQNPTTNNHSSVALSLSSTPNEDVAEQSKPQESNITQLGGVSAVTKKTIEVRKDGVYQGCIGTKYRKNGVIRIDYESNPNPTENNHGHYTLADGTIVINASNDANCFMNAIAAGLSESERKKLGINSGKDLFNKLEAHRLAHPVYAMQSDIGYQTLLRDNPASMLRGAGVWADTATGLQGIEAWLDAHPALLSLMKNTGSVVGGAMWLKNLTPVGLVSYLVTNYGYDQVLKLLDGKIEIAKAHLTTYFLDHDSEITPEQAGYLANFAMQVLKTAGQIAVHQVAATKFNALRKRIGGKQGGLISQVVGKRILSLMLGGILRQYRSQQYMGTV